MKKNIITLLIFSLALNLSAQSVNDALLFSQTTSVSTARMAGIGGGMSALGGEFSVVNVNPAGLAIYRSSEFSITPSFNFGKTEGQLAGAGNNVFDENTSSFNFNNLGLVLNSMPSGNWKTSNFAIGYNRIANFNQSLRFEGQSTGSIADHFQELATGADGVGIPAQQLDDFLAGPAFDVTAIYDSQFDPVLIYRTDFELAPDGLVERSQTLERRGSINELSLSLAGNYRNKFLIGGSLGIPILNFSQSRSYEEIDPGTDPDGNIPFFESLQFTDTINTGGVGVNLKLGIIYWPTTKLRIGAAVHSPTFYSLSDFYDTSIQYTTTIDGLVESLSSLPAQPREIDYGFRTPWRFIGSGGLIIPQFGLLSAEVEYVNYGNNVYNLDKDGNSIFDTDRGDIVNAEIEDELQSALNIRVGAEYKIERILLRAGYNWSASARANQDDVLTRISVGAGYRADRVYLDLAYVRGSREDIYSPYSLENSRAEQQVNRQLASNNILFTLGYRF